MECPNCRRISPEGALRCDCGYDFFSRTIRESYVVQELQRRNPDKGAWLEASARSDLRNGLLCLACGGFIIVVVRSCATTSLGISELAVHLPALYGLALINRGMKDRKRAKGAQWSDVE
jgi:hypothetical protein